MNVYSISFTLGDRMYRYTLGYNDVIAIKEIEPETKFQVLMDDGDIHIVTAPGIIKYTQRINND